MSILSPKVAPWLLILLVMPRHSHLIKQCLLEDCLHYQRMGHVFRSCMLLEPSVSSRKELQIRCGCRALGYVQPDLLPPAAAICSCVAQIVLSRRHPESSEQLLGRSCRQEKPKVLLCTGVLHRAGLGSYGRQSQVWRRRPPCCPASDSKSPVKWRKVRWWGWLRATTPGWLFLAFSGSFLGLSGPASLQCSIKPC